MTGPEQRYKGLLAFYVDRNGNCEITLGQYFDVVNPNNSDAQWMWPVRELISGMSKLFLIALLPVALLWNRSK